MFKILSVNISIKKGCAKEPVKSVEFVENYGIVGDAHAGPMERQVSLIAWEDVRNWEKKNSAILSYGAFAENISTEGIDLCQLTVGTIIGINNIILEITQIGKECHSKCSIMKTVGDCIMPQKGIFARVVKGGGFILNENTNNYYIG